MFRRGFLDEVRGLLAKGYGRGLKPMGALGYRHAVAHLLDGVPLAETLGTMKRDTRRYAKRQETWLSAEPGLVRLPPRDALREASGMVRNLLS
jgi:tRNA dimethylallyltransferase